MTRWLAVAAIGVCTWAWADSGACVSEAERGQQARRDGKWTAALSAFASCSTNDCPSMVRSDCSRWHQELTKVLPTVTVMVTEPEGMTSAEVQLTLDGAAIVLGEKTLVDPAPHTVQAVADGFLSSSRTVDVTPATHVVVSLALIPELAPAKPTVRRKTAFGLGLGGLAVGAIGIGFGLTSRNELGALNRACAPRCAPELVANARLNATIADVAFAAAATAGVIAVVLWIIGDAQVQR